MDIVIPRRIHQIWLGPRPAPLVWMESWQQLNPDLAYRIWGESEIGELGLRNRDVYRRSIEEGIFDGAADVARVEILNRFGGIYADADSVALRSLQDESFLDAEIFAVAEPDEDGRPGLISNAFIGATAEHPLLGRYMDAIASVTDLRPMWSHTGPGALTRVVQEERTEIVVLPAWIFFATTLDGDEVSGGDPLARHFWSTTAERWGRRGGTPYPT
jgi:mannosyltransferase OCH1-like enzyme